MPRIDPDIAVHNITLKPDSKPVKKKMRKMHPRIALLVKEEIQRLLYVSFILPIDYPQLISNIVPVTKATGGLQICTDFRDLNLACPKDDFPLPSIDQLVDLTAGHEMLSLMDGFSGYNQILVALSDQHKTAFITPWGTFYYHVMPFGLKNARATYQRAMTYIFPDIMHTILEDYVNDLLGKSKHCNEHLNVLTIIFDRLLQYSVRLQPKKCVFGVLSGKLLGFIVSLHGIEVNPSKVKAILEMPPPKNLKQLRSLQDPIHYMYAKPHLNQCITCWLMLLTDLDLKFVQQKSIKGQTITDQLAEAPLPGEQFTNFNFPDELITTLSLREESYQMTLFFDGSKCQCGGGAGIVLIPLDAEPMPLSFQLDFPCTNNTAEYEALVLGLQVALHLGVKSINIFGDSQLVVNQVMGIYQCKNEELQKYKHYVDSLLTSFTRYSIQTIPRSTNKFVDTMACLASQIPTSPTDSDIFILV
ncbi:hypothetical protein KI387_044021 [Taxus chinensis]|uniref:RNase H type-1 domain-containing protein n=1 Tax=Taxus chinensis TaxID=29808 RepID=A0AA38G7V4_TAXCH|nr:hypothetical protein KI387_044021 [Taxus chinensis]